MNEYTASNGISIESRDGALISKWPNTHDHLKISVGEAEALREFFRAEEDERLGRWRWPENPDYVVYPIGVGDAVAVVQESDGGQAILARDSANRRDWPDFWRAANAYFDAHPEPKPEWYDAQHDEVWVLTTPATGERPYQVVRTEEAGFRFFLISDHEGFRPGLFPNEAQITAGRRIYPEPS